MTSAWSRGGLRRYVLCAALAAAAMTTALASCGPASTALAPRGAATTAVAPRGDATTAVAPRGDATTALAPRGDAVAGPALARPIIVRQLITVTAASATATSATFVAYRRAGARGAGGRWIRVFGPWTARVGYNGIAPPGQKREGDGRTPSGTYGFSFFFGVRRNPGVAFPFRHAYAYDVWDDDPASPLYNEWVDDRTVNPGASPEPMHLLPAYQYAAVIAYNTARTPGLGSAIFLHVGTGGSTAGCVSLPIRELLQVLRWLKPARSPRITIQVTQPGR